MSFLAYLILVFLPYPFVYAANNTITATGGGVVETGKDLILKYNINSLKPDETWSGCKWLRYEPTGNNDETKTEYCLFLLKENGTAEKLNCNPTDFMETNQMEYIGTNKNECTIKVGNASVDDSVTWKVNLLSEPTGKSIAITVATPLENITQELTPQSIEAGAEGVVNCTVFGGKPAPVITFFNGAAVEGNSNLTVTNRTVTTEVLENGKLKTVASNTIVPQIEDHGRTIECVAVQYDQSEDKHIIFDTQGTNGSLNANKLTLDVQFSPQPIEANKTFDYVKGQDAQISIMINANPKPTSIKWVVMNRNDTNSSNSTDQEANDTDTNSSNSTDQEASKAVDIDLPTTEIKERYTLYNLTEGDGLPTKYVANLTINNITDSDHLNSYYLTVTNIKGSQNYYFDINITDFVPTTTTPAPTTTPVGTTPGIATEKSNGAVTAIVVIVVLAIVVVGGVIFYKKYYLNRQTVPHYNLR